MFVPLRILRQGNQNAPAMRACDLRRIMQPILPGARFADDPELRIIRKSGTWEDWLHDTAEVAGPHRRCILVALTKDPQGDEHFEGVARGDEELIANLR